MNDYIPGSECPCGCGATGSKLSFRTGHVAGNRGTPGCRCRPCIGLQNRRKGQRGQAKGHKALGGQGFTPTHEESVGGYPIVVQVEWKSGEQIPKSFETFKGLEWTRRALSQANRARRIGDGSMPAVGIDGEWLVVHLKRDQDGVA